jgi:membrane-associated phospholipid phosphatase
VVAAGVAAPPLRRYVRLGPVSVIGGAAAAPIALCVAMPRSRRRDVAVCVLQMYAYLAAYEMPHDEPEDLRRRVHVDYPVRIDRLLGLGELPTVRLQRKLARRGTLRAGDKALVWTHWLWFFVPHGTVAYILWRHRERFPRAAVHTYAVFDAGAIFYWLVPTAPPWYAAAEGRIGLPGDASNPAVRRMMVEYGEAFWRDGWGPLYSVLGGNPLAAMPSLHFATSVMAASLLAETGPAAGAAGATYALALGFALVYVGEHYFVDLLGGLALTVAVRRLGRRAGPRLEIVGRAVAALGTLAQEAG